MQISRVESEKYLRYVVMFRLCFSRNELLRRSAISMAAQTRIAFHSLGCHFPRIYSAIDSLIETRNIAPNLGIKSGLSKFTARKVGTKDEEVRSLEKVACP